jgi:hypothetical protein
MLGLRLPRGHRSASGVDVEYAMPQAHSIEIAVNNSIVGEIVTRGKIIAGDQSAADFEQRIRVTRGKRMIEIGIEVASSISLAGDPWKNYLCSRVAWPNEGATLYRAINESRVAIAESRIEAPQYIEIVDEPNRIAILTNGLPFHRRHEYRQLDSLLVVQGERQRSFRLGIGVDLPSAMHAATELSLDPIIVETDATPRVDQPAAWLFRVDCRNINVLAIEAIRIEGRIVGALFRLKETEGRAGQGRVQAALPIVEARRVRLDGETKSELNITGGAAEFGFAAHEYFQLDLRW